MTSKNYQYIKNSINKTNSFNQNLINEPTTINAKQNHLTNLLINKFNRISIQSNKLSRLCQKLSIQSHHQTELAIYYSSMLMATARVFNLDQTEEDDDSNDDIEKSC
ncbi:hypothetical protein O181_028318 [Austropuccinia psidii MF-1]|uniref:Uncharacterized protein n=1 Tax=Austropuccinia psidii MF-1 TaxID=1389203 RepID=A0A9Q3H1P9_9BASI|nr:hypothetical protein [Austropuccinia psidii MF-1]